MRKNSKIIALLLLGSNAMRLNDIFDSYDEESALEQLKEEDQIDPAALTAEIGGDEIARDVMLATGGIADQNMLQIDQRFIPNVSYVPSEDIYMHLRPIRDADGDGVEDNEQVSSHWQDKHAKYVFGRELDNMHNTHNGEVPGHTNIADSPEPGKDENVEAEVDLSWNYGDNKPADLLMTKYIDIMQSPDDLQMLQTSAIPKAFKPRMIYDLDGDGVQDNR